MKAILILSILLSGCAMTPRQADALMQFGRDMQAMQPPPARNVYCDTYRVGNTLRTVCR